MSSFFSHANRFRTGAFISVIGFTLYSFPMLAHFTSNQPTIDSEKPLKPDAVRRGAFNNSGSRDIGPECVSFFHLILFTIPHSTLKFADQTASGGSTALHRYFSSPDWVDGVHIRNHTKPSTEHFTSTSSTSDSTPN